MNLSIITTAIRMTRITCLAVVLIARHIIVFIVHILLIMFMAKNALKNCKIIRINMTITASIPFVIMLPGINREILPVMIPGGVVPVSRVVALLTIGWETGGTVIGVGGILIIRLVAAITIRGRIVVAVGVAVNALQVQMRSG